MLDIFPSSLNLPLTEHTHRGNDPWELAVALAPRAELGSLKMAQLRVLSKDSLEEEAGMLRQMHRVIREALDNPSRSKQPIGVFLSRLDIGLVSKDQGWRIILDCLNKQDLSYEAHKRVGLLEYQSYLQARLELVETLLGSAAKRKPAKPRGMSKKLSQNELSETSEFLLGDAKPEKLPKRAYKRLPKGDTVEIQLEPQHSLHLSLAKHRFTLVPGDPYRLIDERGRESIVPVGKSIVGRGPTVDVGVNDGYRSVSRSHAIMEVSPGGQIKITDVSSHGTYLLRDPKE